MPRQTTEVLFGYGFNVNHNVVDEQGTPVVDEHGKPAVHLTFADEQGHAVVIPLTDEGRRRLALALTGGVHLATRQLIETG